MDQGPGDAGYAEDVPVFEQTFVSGGEPREAISVKEESGMVNHSSFCALSGDLIAK